MSLMGYLFFGAVSSMAGLKRTISVAVIELEATDGNDASCETLLVTLITNLLGDFIYY